MTDRNVALEGAAIVVKGHFNPAIFSPAWLDQQDLIGSLELERQEVDIITRDFAAFSLGWASIHVTQESLQVSTGDVDEMERVRDLAAGILRALFHTPVATMGINREFHFTVSDKDRWHAIGDALIPKQPWEGTLQLPGTRSVTLWGARPDHYGGRINVKVEPSLRVPQAVYVSVNDHFDFVEREEAPQRTRDGAWSIEQEDLTPSTEKIPLALRILADEWAESLKRADQCLDVVWRLGQE